MIEILVVAILAVIMTLLAFFVTPPIAKAFIEGAYNAISSIPRLIRRYAGPVGYIL